MTAICEVISHHFPPARSQNPSCWTSSGAGQENIAWSGEDSPCAWMPLTSSLMHRLLRTQVSHSCVAIPAWGPDRKMNRFLVGKVKVIVAGLRGRPRIACKSACGNARHSVVAAKSFKSEQMTHNVGHETAVSPESGRGRAPKHLTL